MIKIIDIIIQRISKTFPNLDLKLKQAGMNQTVDEFIKKTLFSAFYMTTGIIIFIGLILSKVSKIFGALFIIAPILFILIFIYFLKLPDVWILKKNREINSEIVFAGRFLIIELESGIPLYDAFKNVTKNYKVIGKYFSEIVTKIDLGTDVEHALNEAVKFTPSAGFRKILWQIINAQQTGADVGKALRNVVDQIAKEQMIEVKEYGRKLNPLAMFYMIIAVILPSIGITMFIVLSTFLNLQLSLSALLVISLFLGFMQFMFLTMIKSSRPSVEL